MKDIFLSYNTTYTDPELCPSEAILALVAAYMCEAETMQKVRQHVESCFFCREILEDLDEIEQLATTQVPVVSARSGVPVSTCEARSDRGRQTVDASSFVILEAASDSQKEKGSLKKLFKDWQVIESKETMKEDSAREYFGDLIGGRWFYACSMLARGKDSFLPDKEEVDAVWNQLIPFMREGGGAWENCLDVPRAAQVILRCAEIVSKTQDDAGELCNRLAEITPEGKPEWFFLELAARLQGDEPIEDILARLGCVKGIQIPVVLVAAGDGITGTLRLDLMKDGEGKVYPAPEMFIVPRDVEFQKALDRAKVVIKGCGLFDDDYDIRWSISVGCPMGILQGGSLGAALIVGMARLMTGSYRGESEFEEKLPRLTVLEHTVFSGAVKKKKRELTRVERNGVKAKITAALKEPLISFLVLPVVASTEVQNLYGSYRSLYCPDIFTIPKDPNARSSPTLTVLCMKNLEEAFDRLESEQEMPREIDWTRGHRGELIARPWLEEAIGEFSSQSSEKRGNGIVLIVGQAGTGKTGFVNDIVSRQRNEGNSPIVHFITRKEEKWDSPEEFMGSLCAALRRKYGMPRPDPEGHHWSKLRGVAVAQEFLLLLKQLSAKGIEETIWLDGLDDAYGDRGRFRSEAGALGELLKAMGSLDMDRLPKGTRIIATTRPPGSHNHLHHLVSSGDGNLIDLDDEINVNHISDDLRRFFGEQFPNMPDDELGPTVEVIHNDRPFLHATLWAGALRKEEEAGKCRSLDELLITDIQRTSRYWCREVPGLHQKEAEVEVLDALGLLACARQPLSVRLLGTLFGERYARRIRGIAKCAVKSKLMVEPTGQDPDDTPLAFFHDYIAEFILRESTCPSPAAKGTFLSPKKEAETPEIGWHSRFATACGQWQQMEDSQAREYSLRFLLSHLRFAEDWQTLEKTITNLDFLQAKLEADSNAIFDFIRLLHKALEGVPQLPSDHESRPLLNDILEALAPHAEPISRDPLLAMQQIHNDLLERHTGEPWFTELCNLLEKIENKGGSWLRTEKSAAGPRPAKLDEHRNVVLDVAFSQVNDNGGCLLATAGADQAIHLWKIDPTLEYLYPIRLAEKDAEAEIPRRKRTMVYPATGVSFFEGGNLYPEGKILVCSSGYGLSVYGINLKNLQKKPEKITRFGFKGIPQKMAASKSKQFPFVVVGNGDSRARVFDVHRLCEIALLGEGMGDFERNSPRRSESFCCVAISPDGRFVAVGSPDDNYTRVWKLSTESYGENSSSIEHELIYELPPPGDRQVDALAFSPDGRFLAVGGGFRHGQVEVWDLRKCSCVRFPAHKDAIWSLAFAPDPSNPAELLLFTGSYERSAAVWECKAIKAMSRMDVVKKRELKGFARSVDGLVERIFQLRDFDLQPQARALVGHPDAILTLDVSPGSGHLAIGGTDYSVSLWDLRSLLTDPHPDMVPLRSPSGADTIHAAAILPGGGKYATAGNFGGVRIRKSETGEKLLSIRAGGGLPVRTVKSSADGRLLAYGTDSGVSIHDLIAGAEIHQSIPGQIYSVAFSDEPETPSLAAGDVHGNVFVMKDLSGGQPVRYKGCHSDRVRGLAFIPGNRWLVSVGDDSRVMLIDLTNERPPIEIAAGEAHRGRIKSVAVSPCGNYIATGGYQTIKMWRRGSDPGNWRQVKTLRGHRHEIWTLSFSSDGTMIASGGHDSTARVWDVASGKQLACLPCWNNVFAVSFGENDRILHVVDAGLSGRVPNFWIAEIRGILQ